nr:putative FBD-associated F-box protein At5g56700 isoform X2 [Setaria viridis]
MQARLRTMSAVAHGTEANMRRRRYEDAAAADRVIVYSYDLPGPGVAGGLLRLGYGVERVGSALRRIKEAREGLGEDESMPLGDKVVIATDTVVGVTHIVVGVTHIVVGACDFAQYARGALARFRSKSSSGGSGRTTTRGKRSYLWFRKRICEKGKYDVQFEDLPEDVQCIIFSKLELKEAVRSSVLSSKWANTWMIHSKLRFDGSKMYGKYMSGAYRTLKFIDNVNRVLKLHHGKVVETLEIKVEFDRILPIHLDNWVSFAAASWTKNLALDLVPENYLEHTERYIFPFELLDGETMSRLQQIQLSFVSFKLPSQFSGFPKLKRLDLYLLHVNRKDLQDMLSGCSNLEWLSIARCDLEDELIVDRPLSHLLYLRVAHCKMTKIELHAAKLRTFIHNGTQLPVHTIQAQELKDAEIAVTNFTTFEHALNVLPKMLARVQNLTLQVPLRLKSSSLLEKSSKFPQLRHLKLLLRHSPEDLDNILSLASFLRAAPLIEELEIHFNITGRGNAEVGRLRNLPKCPYKHLRNICISGFIGTQGQAELLVHAVENAPALEVVTIDTANKSGNSLFQDVDRRGAYIARSCLEGKISPKTKLHINNCSCEGLHQEWVLI